MHLSVESACQLCENKEEYEYHVLENAQHASQSENKSKNNYRIHNT